MKLHPRPPCASYLKEFHTYCFITLLATIVSLLSKQFILTVICKEPLFIAHLGCSESQLFLFVLCVVSHYVFYSSSVPSDSSRRINLLLLWTHNLLTHRRTHSELRLFSIFCGFWDFPNVSLSHLWHLNVRRRWHGPASFYLVLSTVFIVRHGVAQQVGSSTELIQMANLFTGELLVGNECRNDYSLQRLLLSNHPSCCQYLFYLCISAIGKYEREKLMW